MQDNADKKVHLRVFHHDCAWHTATADCTSASLLNIHAVALTWWEKRRHLSCSHFLRLPDYEHRLHIVHNVVQLLASQHLLSTSVWPPSVLSYRGRLAHSSSAPLVLLMSSAIEGSDCKGATGSPSTLVVRCTFCAAAFNEV